MGKSSAIRLPDRVRTRRTPFGKPRACVTTCPSPRTIEPRRLKSLPLRAPHIITRAASLIIVDRSDIRSIGLGLSQLHEALADTEMSNVEVVHLALHLVTPGQRTPCSRMAFDLALQADDMGERHPYHNAQHLREVTVNMVNLCVLNLARHEHRSLDENDLTMAIALAVGHSLGHDGSTNCISRVVPLDNRPLPGDQTEMVYVPFLQEDRAIAAINSAGRRSGVAEGDLRRMRAALLATDECAGYQVLDAILDPSTDPERKVGLFGMRPELAELGDNPTALHLATMLRDADLMGSCGTCAAETDRQTDRLERERGLYEGSLRGKGTEYFLGTIARGRFLSPEAQIFQPNLAYLRILNRLRLQAADPAAVTLAEIEDYYDNHSVIGFSPLRTRSSRLIKGSVTALH
jgi:hypothetical protein